MTQLRIIKLKNGQWRYDPATPLGAKGGFGQVFLGYKEDGSEVAVKRLHISSDEAGNRELAIADDLMKVDHEHIIPVYDSGIDAESNQYFVVMARAERSLQEHFQNQKLDEK